MSETKHTPEPWNVCEGDGMHVYCVNPIAAAPDLLKALVVAADWLADKGVPADHVEMVRIRVAIAAAEKETPEAKN